MTDTSRPPSRLPRYALIAVLTALAAPPAVLISEQIAEGPRGLAWQIVTGSLLTMGLAHQWCLSLARILGDARAATSLLAWHKWAGIAMLVAFILHAPGFGHVWTSTLAAVFLACAFLGAFNRETMRRMGRGMYLAWFGLHTALAAVLVPMALTHIWIALVYE